jgi:hypothetical protein
MLAAMEGMGEDVTERVPVLVNLSTEQLTEAFSEDDFDLLRLLVYVGEYIPGTCGDRLPSLVDKLIATVTKTYERLVRSALGLEAEDEPPTERTEQLIIQAVDLIASLCSATESAGLAESCAERLLARVDGAFVRVLNDHRVGSGALIAVIDAVSDIISRAREQRNAVVGNIATALERVANGQEGQPNSPELVVALLRAYAVICQTTQEDSAGETIECIKPVFQLLKAAAKQFKWDVSGIPEPVVAFATCIMSDLVLLENPNGNQIPTELRVRMQHPGVRRIIQQAENAHDPMIKSRGLSLGRILRL